MVKIYFNDILLRIAYHRTEKPICGLASLITAVRSTGKRLQPASFLQLTADSLHEFGELSAAVLEIIKKLQTAAILPVRINNSLYVLYECLRVRNPGTDFRFFEMNEIQVVAFLASFKKVIVNLSHLFGNFAGFDIMSIKKAACPCVFRRR